MVLFLPNDRKISSRRLWTVRVVLALLVLGQQTTQSTAAAVNIQMPLQSAGFLLGVAFFYWVSLQLLSSKIDDPDVSTTNA